MLKDFAKVSEDLVNQFADPVVSLLASISGRKTLDMVRDMGRVRRETRQRQELMRQWQKRACAVAS
jgi:uncharacterized protein YcgL (UPF0745 family)